MRFMPKSAIYSLLTLVLTMTALPARAEQPPALDEAGAKALLFEATEFIESRQSFTTTVHTNMHVEAQGQKHDVSLEHQISAAAPNRLAVRPNMAADDPMAAAAGGNLISDGQQVYADLPALRKYSLHAAPEQFSDVLGNQQQPDYAISTGQLALLRMVLSSENIQQIVEDSGVQYHGIEAIDGQPCHRIQVDLEEGPGTIELHLWVQTGDEPLIRQVQPDFEKFVAQMAQTQPHMADMKMSMTYSLTGWQINEAIDDAVFQIAPPQGYEKVDSLITAVQGHAGGGGGGDTHGLVGQDAPAIQLDTVQGQAFNLKDVNAKVVVLDFWATWCGPCREGLPGLQKIHEWSQQENKSVAIYTVNVRETPEQVKGFWESHKLSMPVLMDAQGQVANAYQVQGIPQTVIIADGKVAHVHVGYRPGLENQLQQEIEALLAAE